MSTVKMPVTERIYERYRVRREVSQTADLAALFLARLRYEAPESTPGSVQELLGRLAGGQLERVSGARAVAFAHWLRKHLMITETVRGSRKVASYCPIHPALSLATNVEGLRVDAFVRHLAGCFSPEERQRLQERLWDPERQPAFERVVFELLSWQLPPGDPAPPASCPPALIENAEPGTPDGILLRAKEDLLALSEVVAGVEAFVAHAGRLLAFTVTRYLLACAGVPLTLPIYAAPAADTHEGVKTLAHEIIDYHRGQFQRALAKQFGDAVAAAAGECGEDPDPADEATAARLAAQLFSGRARIVRPERYAEMRERLGSFTEVALAYYWSESRASGRFLRQLHTAHLNLAKKAGIANSRSRQSQWHFYWLSPSLVDTLLLASRARFAEDRVLVADLLDEWRERYGVALLIDAGWEAEYRRSFRALGSPDALNEANQRRFSEILSEQGRIHKNSDEFPWVLLRD